MSNMVIVSRDEGHSTHAVSKNLGASMGELIIMTVKYENWELYVYQRCILSNFNGLQAFGVQTSVEGI